MAAYTGQQRFLVQAATQYASLGYKVGFAKGKEFLGEYQPPSMSMWGPVQSEQPTGFDGLSLLPHGMVCVDIDINDFSVVYEGLPITLKEKTPRGWHLFYRIAEELRCNVSPRIKWREHVDLLTKPGKIVPRKKAIYGSMRDDGSPWGEHVLSSPTDGYKRIWPDEIPAFKDLTIAPGWLMDALEK